MISHGSTGDKTFTANWTVNQYTLTFNADNGTAPFIITGNYGESFNTPTDPTKEGHTFSGWNPAVPATMPMQYPTITAEWNACQVCEAGNGASCSLTVTGNQCTYINACLPGYTGLQNATSYNPSCSVITYPITYNLNGGTTEDALPTTYTVETETITLPQPTRTGYTFA
ncbi:InlB B-repeat-containing protein [bacterium]|nr:InlB B-repeat-containing protein [bacterium]